MLVLPPRSPEPDVPPRPAPPVAPPFAYPPVAPPAAPEATQTFSPLTDWQIQPSGHAPSEKQRVTPDTNSGSKQLTAVMAAIASSQSRARAPSRSRGVTT